MSADSKYYVRPGEWAVLAFTVAYTVGFSVWFMIEGNREFIVYVLTMVLLVALVGSSIRKAEYPIGMLLALAVWGLAHMSGGGIPVGDSVLYSYVLWPVVGSGELTILKYDQVVHCFGFAVTSWVLWHLMAHHYPVLRHTWTIYIYSALASVGLGAVNEIIEFSAVLMVADTNVGGYFNTALDLVFNTIGAVSAMLLVGLSEMRRA